MTQSARIQRLGFYVTSPHACSYLSNRQSVTLFADPRYPKTNSLYASLSQRGFRRSGEHLYQPHCPGCSACIPIRIPVNEFRPRRQQRRTWRQNQDLHVSIKSSQFEAEHFELYCRYLAARHVGGGMDDPSPNSYMNFLTASWSDTVFIEFRTDDQQLLAVAVTDRLPDAFSAVYTFFEPEAARRSLGRQAILYQIELARNTRRSWLYLGYWIADCRKMAYKAEYQPLEYLRRGQWHRDPA